MRGKNEFGIFEGWTSHDYLIAHEMQQSSFSPDTPIIRTYVSVPIIGVISIQPTRY